MELHEVETAKVLDTLGDTFETAETFARFILLHADPLTAGSNSGLDDGRNINLAHAEGTILKPTAIVLHGVIRGDADKSVRSLGELAFEIVVLGVYYGYVAVVLGYFLSGVKACILSPANVKFVLEVDAVVATEDVVIANSTIGQSDKLKVVVVIKQLETCLAYLGTYLAETGNGSLELLRVDAGTAGLVHVGEHDVLHAEDGILSNDLINIVNHLLIGYVVGERNETQFGAPALHLRNAVTIILTVELHAGIAHFTHFLQCSIEILLQVGTYAVKLYANRQFLAEVCFAALLATSLGASFAFALAVLFALSLTVLCALALVALLTFGFATLVALLAVSLTVLFALCLAAFSILASLAIVSTASAHHYGSYDGCHKF